MTPQLNRKAVTRTLAHCSPLPLLTHRASQVSTSCIKPVRSQNSPSDNYCRENLAHAGFSIIHFHKLSLMGILLQRQDSRKTIAMNNCVLLQISIFKYRARGQLHFSYFPDPLEKIQLNLSFSWLEAAILAALCNAKNQNRTLTERNHDS